jgi:hypothetical protein
MDNEKLSLENRQLDGAAYPGASRIALGPIQHRLSGEKRPARIEIRSRQLKPDAQEAASSIDD